MNEATKTLKLYPELRDYTFGKSVLDIGAGNDPVCPHATIFDKEQGNAEEIYKFFAPDTFDTVFASHCLEHMSQPINAIVSWYELVKPGGHLVILIPDEDLYEQGYFPSIFNADHKRTFTTKIRSTWSSQSISTSSLLSPIIGKGGLVEKLELQHDNYDFALIRFPGKIVHALTKIPRLFWFLFPVLQRFNLVPIDQTKQAKSVLAQIMIIIRKSIPTDESGIKE